jgi:outer membrane protein assembly factor BamD (BamD/ComL family)
VLRPFAAKTPSTAQPYKPSSATDAVETGTKCFESKEYGEALRLYKAAMDMRPNDDEARAATYNAACVYVKKKQWKEAVDSLKASVNDYGLKVRVIYEVRVSCRLFCPICH